MNTNPIPFLLPTDREGVFEMHMDNSSKELFETCARAAQYYTAERRESSAQRPAIFRGSIAHGALAIRKQAQIDGRADFEPQQITYIMEAYAAQDFGEDEWRTAEHAIKTIQAYNKQWPIESEPFTIIPGTIEQPFKILLGHANLESEITTHAGTFYVGTVEIYWTGKRDADIIYGQPIALEHKTTSILGPSFWDDFQLSSQGHGYVWAGRKLGLDLQGIYVDALAGRKPSKSGVAIEFQRQRIFYDTALLDEWERDTFTLITDFLEHLCRGYFPKSPKWCFGKYGKCQYWDVCTQPPNRRQDVLASSLYQPVTWSPLNNNTNNNDNSNTNNSNT